MIRKIGLSILYVAIPAILSLVIFGALSSFFMGAKDPTDPTNRLFEVPINASFREIAQSLQDQQLIRSQLSLRILAKLKGLGSGIKAGEYLLNPAMRPHQILEILLSGNVLLRKVTIKEGQNMMEISIALSRQQIVAREAFFKAVQDEELLNQFSIDAINFEGYLFPETYQFPKGTPAKKIVVAMYEQLQSRWKPEWDVRLTELGMDRHQLLTLASIIEKESGDFSEQPLISSVFHNRLRRQMPLQSDPTVIYLLWDFNGNLTKENLQTKHPYNTYVIKGLPPGPIANPGLSAIEAALFPAKTNFLFFVANGQGRHVFSETLSEHNDAVNRYQRKTAN